MQAQVAPLVGLNLAQLLLPLVAFGDFATNIWFIVELSHRADNNSMFMLAVASISQGLEVGAGICRGCRAEKVLPDRLPCKLFYFFCHGLNAFNLYLFLFQRAGCFGPRNKQFEEVF